MNTAKDTESSENNDDTVSATPPVSSESRELSQTADVTRHEDIDEAAHATNLPQPSLQTVAQVSTTQEKPQNNPTILVLQWLTYAFWGWFALSIMWLILMTIGFIVTSASENASEWAGGIAYPIAATIVLFLVASVVDVFYSRVEPARKQSVATAIMVIHAVIFALCGIGWMISSVFSLISFGLTGGVDESATQIAQVTLYSSFIMIVIYALLIVRTLLVSKIRHVAIIVTVVFGVLSAVFIALGVIGPVAQSIATRSDRELEATLAYVPDAVEDYVQENKKLPASLSEVNVDADMSFAKNLDRVIQKGAIRYTPNVKDADTNDYELGSMTYYYKLCVTWVGQKGGGDDRSYSLPSDGTSADNQYKTYISAYSHKKGEQCYDLRASTGQY